MKYSFIPSTDGTRWVVLSDNRIPIFFLEKTQHGMWSVIDFTNVVVDESPMKESDFFAVSSIEKAVSMIHNRLSD